MPDGALMSELGRELRRGRLSAGYRTQLELAILLQVDRSSVSRVESGTRLPTEEMLREWCQVCTLDHARLAGLARGSRGAFPDWFEHWRDDVEAISRRLAYWNPIIVPAVARTKNYIAAVLGAGGGSPGANQIAGQMARAAALDRAEIVIVVHEMALRRFVGSLEIMLEQLHHLAHVAESPSVHVHVVPNTETVPGMSGAFSLSHDLAVVHMDGLRGRTTSDPDVFKDASVLFDRIRAHALPRGDSRRMILEVAGTMENLTWHKASKSDNGGECVEIGCSADGTAQGIRDSKRPHDGYLAITPTMLGALLASARRGELDR